MTVRIRLGDEPDRLRLALGRLRGTLEKEPLTRFSPRRLDALHTAVAEAALNAVEHAHGWMTQPPIEITVRVAADEILVRVTDQGPGIPPAAFAHIPDPVAKLRGEQEERGWGLFLMRTLVDEVRTRRDQIGHHVELVLRPHT